MSGKLIGQIWGLKLAPAKRDLLIALADHAKDDGSNAYPGLDLLAWKLDISRRQCQRLLDQLEVDGLIIPTSKAARGKPVVYQIDLSKGVKKSPYLGRQNVTHKQDKMSPQTETIRVTSHEKNIPNTGDMPSAKVVHNRKDLTVNKEKESTHQPYHIAHPNGMNSAQEQQTDLLAIKGSPIWQAFKNGWDGLEPDIPPTMARTVRTAIDVLRKDIEANKYTLVDIEALTRQKLANPKTRGYRITFIKTDIAEYLAAKRAQRSITSIFIDPTDEPDDSDSLTWWVRKVDVS